MNINTSVDDASSSIDCAIRNCSTPAAFLELRADLFNALCRCPLLKKTMRNILTTGIRKCDRAIANKKGSKFVSAD